jgi:aspartate kinase
LLKGTSVSRGVNLEPYLPCFIVKEINCWFHFRLLTFPLLWKKTSVKYFLYSMSLNWK